jgi:hypothetical protein
VASPAPSGGGGKILGLKPRTAMIAGVVVLGGSVGYLLWRRRQSAKDTATSASASSSTTGAYGVDYGGELSVLQSELEDLLAAEGNEPATTGAPTGTGTGTGTGSSGGGTAPKGSPPGSTPGGTLPGGTKAKPGTPTGVHPTKTAKDSVTLAWNRAPNATSYRVRVTYQGKLVGSEHTVNGTSATISGLHPDHTYTFHVAAVGPGGTSAETNGPAVKTSR